MTTPASVTLGNSKLGSLIHGWSIPAGKKYSCPGESAVCGPRCYAKLGHFHQTNVKTAHLRNFEFSQTESFVPWMISTIISYHVRVMRVHCAGDYYNTRYITDWSEIVQRSQRTLFFAYTRSWRDETLLPDLIRLSQFENMSLWWSMDRATGPAPLVRGIRRAYLAIDDVDAQNAPNDCDLVFRDKRKTVMKKANGVLVCPPENGTKPQFKITCSRCQLCWKPRDSHWEDLLLPHFAEDETIDTEILAPDLCQV